MAKQIIILRQRAVTGLADKDVDVLFWFPVPLARRVPITETSRTGEEVPASSAWTGASASENAAIADGSVVEIQESVRIEDRLSTTEAKAVLLGRWTSLGNELAAKPNPNRFFGVFFDSVTGWSA